MQGEESLVIFLGAFACRNLAKECMRVIKMKTLVEAWLEVAIQQENMAEKEWNMKVSQKKGEKPEAMCSFPLPGINQIMTLKSL